MKTPARIRLREIEYYLWFIVATLFLLVSTGVLRADTRTAIDKTAVVPLH